MQMRKFINVGLVFLVIAGAAGCGKSDPPPPPATDAARSSAPVKNVESLPSGTIQEGGRTMNRAADLGKSLEQQKQDRDKEAEAQTK